MTSVNFYPGPSKIYPQVKTWMAEAMDSGILSMNHRSADFMELLAHAFAGMKSKLMIPDEYEVFLVSSATECWEIIAQSLIREKSIHIYNGAFGEKWFEYTRRICKGADGLAYNINEFPSLPENHDVYDLLCLTHNETSNGTHIPMEALKTIRNDFQGLIAMDATSSMGGVQFDWASADVWFASVQKCFGLPPGMGIMVVSPMAMEVALKIQDRSYYNSLLFVADNFRKFQTPYTPNTLGIYLLSQLFQEIDNINHIEEQTNQGALEWFTFFESRKIPLLVTNPMLRSKTVIPFLLSGNEETIRVKQYLKSEGVIIGNGYGLWKENTLRIANFPAISKLDRSKLMEKLDRYYS